MIDDPTIPDDPRAAIYQRWMIGWHDDAPGPFETREFAAAVAREMAA